MRRGVNAFIDGEERIEDDIFERSRESGKTLEEERKIIQDKKKESTISLGSGSQDSSVLSTDTNDPVSKLLRKKT